MAWEKKPIDKMEMMHLLGIIYARTSAGFGKVGLLTLIKEEGKPTVRGKCDIIVKALVRSKLLLYEGNAKYRRYRWNMKEYGPVSIPIAEMMILETEYQRRVYERERRARRRQLKKAV